MTKWREYEDIFDTIVELLNEYKEDGKKWKIISSKLQEFYNLDELNSENVRGYYRSEKRRRGVLDELLQDENSNVLDEEQVQETVRLAKQSQKFRDKNRIERATFRNNTRIGNALEAYNKELIKILKDFDLSDYTQVHDSTDSGAAGILHFADPHFNELVELSINRADFTVLSRRCKKLITKTKQYFNLFNVKNVLFAMTGDILNSDRRLDELLNQSTNRSKALVLTVHIIKQMLIDLNKDFNITVASVTGNESRKGKDIGYSEIITSDNYDFDVHEFLKYLFNGCEGIEFSAIDDSSEQVIEVAGQNILLLHGHQKLLTGSNLEQGVQKIVGKYSDRGIDVKFVIFGHLHSCRIGDTYARGSSLVGANAYSDKGLHLVSRASQNIHIIYDGFSRDSIRIDLQDTEGIEGYDVVKELEAYHAKSAEKIHERIEIMKIII